MSIEHPVEITFEDALLLRLAILGGYMTQPQLKRGLRLHGQIQPQRHPLPLSSLLVEWGLLDGACAVDLLASQQALLGQNQSRSHPIRLSARTDRLLGELICSHELVDLHTLEACRLTRETWARQGLERPLGALLLEMGALRWDDLRRRLTTCRLAELWQRPAGIDGGAVLSSRDEAADRQARLRSVYFNHRPACRKTIALFRHPECRRA